MKIKHLIILLFVNCGSDVMSPAAKSLSTSEIAGVSETVKSISLLFESNFISPIFQSQVSNSEITSRSTVSCIYSSQIDYLDKTLMTSEYLKYNLFKLDERLAHSLITNGSLLRAT